MARPASYWLDKIFGEKQTLSNLSQYTPNSNSFKLLLEKINNLSKVAYWELICWPVAVAMADLDVVFDLFKLDLENIVKRSRFGSDYSYIIAAKEFQYGDSLVWDQVNLQWRYEAVDLVKRIIKYSFLEEDVENTLVKLKVARLFNDAISPLDTQQLQAFNAYMSRVSPAGIVCTIISQDPDLLNVEYDVIYDPLVLTEDGEAIDEPGVFPVADAIEAYITEVNEGFKGVFNNDNAVDKIQAAKGVIHAYAGDTRGKADGEAYSGTFAKSYLATAGYMKVDPAFPLDESITYTAGDV